MTGRCRGHALDLLETAPLPRITVQSPFRWIDDSSWKDHLLAMDHLKSGIGLRGYAEQDPRVAYKREGARQFQEMLAGVVQSRRTICPFLQLQNDVPFARPIGSKCR